MMNNNFKKLKFNINELALFYRNIDIKTFDNIPIVNIDNIIEIIFSSNNKRTYNFFNDDNIFVSDIPFKYMFDFENELNRLDVYLQPIKKNIKDIQPVPLFIPDTNIAISKYGIYIDNELVLFIDHKKKIIFNKYFESKSLYDTIITSCQLVGYELNNTLDKEYHLMNEETIHTIYNMQNRLDLL